MNELNDKLNDKRYLLDILGIDVIIRKSELPKMMADREIIIRFTVPEKIVINKNTVNMPGLPFNEISSEELIPWVKDTLFDIYTEGLNEGYKYVAKKEFYRFFCKVRKGEVWTETQLMYRIMKNMSGGDMYGSKH